MATMKILVAIDESEGAKRALRMAESIAEPNPEAHLDLVYVVPIPLLNDGQAASFKDILDMMIADGEDLLAEAKESLGSVSDRAGAFILTGVNPATEILKMVEKDGYDLVVIGSRGLSGIKQYLGSVSHKVLNGANVSVLVAK